MPLSVIVAARPNSYIYVHGLKVEGSDTIRNHVNGFTNLNRNLGILPGDGDSGILTFINILVKLSYITNHVICIALGILLGI